MKPTIAIVLIGILAIPLVARADDNRLGEARRLLLGGKYAEAEEIYASEAERDPAAALGLARCRAAAGKLDEAVGALRAVAGEHGSLHAELALLAFERGDYKTAKTESDAALKLDAERLPARWIRGELLRVSGRIGEAGEAYRWLVDYHNSHEIDRAESLCWIGLAAARYARWNRLPEEFHFLVGELYPEALKLQPGYWPAHYEAGRLFLEKHNRAEAARQLKAALALNPNAAEVHAVLGRLALEGRDIRQAEASIARALELNPRLQAAWLVKAELVWANFRPQEAVTLLKKKILPLNPHSQQALGRLGACYVLLDGLRGQGKNTRFKRLIEEVDRSNPHAGEFYLSLATWLDTRSRLPQAERFDREARKRMPQKVGPRSQLGLLYMRCGREDEARKLFKTAFEVDPFNVRVNNMLELFEVLDTLDTVRTEQCVLKFDAAGDKLLSRYATRYLDTIYPQLCREFGYRPADRPLIEIFNHARGAGGHKWFSTRMTGLPYIGTVAACTGKVVAMVSPCDRAVARKFNWARVLKHELVHVVTLQQTDFNIPHWYTEALAVHSEGYPRPASWNALLRRRVPQGKLFDLDTINFGFTRPASGDDWQMAYCQAEFYVEYMLDRRREEVIRELLAAYGDNLSTRQAIEKVFGVSQEEFEKGYVAYLRKIVAGVSGLRPPEPERFAHWLKEHRQNPKDADAAAELANAYLCRRAYREALQAADTALESDPKHQLATYVLARLHLRTKRVEEAVEMLEGCLDRDRPQINALNLLAGLRLKAEKYDEAARLYSLGAKKDPANVKWLRSLARVYVLAQNNEKLIKTLTQLAETDADDVVVRRKLAQMSLDRQDYAAAERWARAALEIDVADASVHRMFAEGLLGRHNNDQAIEEFETAVVLKPDNLHTRFALADACLQAGKREKARAVLEALLKMAPDYPGADLLLENLE